MAFQFQNAVAPRHIKSPRMSSGNAAVPPLVPQQLMKVLLSAGCCWLMLLLLLLPTCGPFSLLMLSWPQLQLGRFRHRLGCGLLVLPPGHL